jgi:hypothetical protein
MLSQTIVVPVLHAWVSPVVDCIKLNIDDAFNEHTRQGGWCFVARDHQGVARGAGAGRIMYAGSTLQTEATACLEAVQAASDWGMGHVHAEMDCLNLANAINGSEYDLAPEEVLFREICSFMLLLVLSKFLSVQEFVIKY